MNALVISENSRITRNTCITRLHRRITDLGIIVCPDGDTDVAQKARGGIHFMRFNPEQTSFQLLPGFPKYFQVAHKYNLLTSRDAHAIVRRLLLFGANLRSKYHGRLRGALETGLIGRFLAADQEALKFLNATENWFPDILQEQLGLPCVVDDYLWARDFTPLRLNLNAIRAIGNNPMLALIGSTGLAVVGHWLGLKTADVALCLDLLNAGTQPEADAISEPESEPYGEKIVMPYFSFGLQGSLIGFFCNITDDQKKHLRTILSEAGRCLWDDCALERKMKVQDILRHNPSTAKTLADAGLQIASPVEHLVVTRAGEHFAYELSKEENYLAGYDSKSGDEAAALSQTPGTKTFEVHALSPKATIHFKPLSGYAALDPVFHALQIKTTLTELFLETKEMAIYPQPTRSNGLMPLNSNDLDQIIDTLQHQILAPHGRVIAAKHLCFFEIIRREFERQETRLSNGEMKSRMSEKLLGLKVNGYQVTKSALNKFQSEIQELLPGRFSFEPLNERVIRIQWSKAGQLN